MFLPPNPYQIATEALLQVTYCKGCVTRPEYFWNCFSRGILAKKNCVKKITFSYFMMGSYSVYKEKL